MTTSTPPPADPNAFTANSFFTSPSTYLTLITYLLPILNMVFGQDVSEVAQAFANAAPIIATGILLVARNRQQIALVQANTVLARIAAIPTVDAPHRNVMANAFVGRHALPEAEERIAALELEIQKVNQQSSDGLRELRDILNGLEDVIVTVDKLRDSLDAASPV